MNKEKKSGSYAGNWTRDSSNFSKAIGIWPKRYNHLATQPLVFKCSKLENWSIFNYISLNKALKSNFWPISGHFRPGRPKPSWSFWKNATFIIKFFFATTRNKVTNRPFWLQFRKSSKFHFNFCKILIYLYLLFLKSIHFCFNAYEVKVNKDILSTYQEKLRLIPKIF